MGRKHRTSRNEENSFLKVVLKSFWIALLIGLSMGVFSWLYTRFELVPLLLFILSLLIFLGMATAVIYLFFRMMKGMREGKGYTVFYADTPIKRFFEYVFVTIMTLGVGLLIIIVVFVKIIGLIKYNI